MENYSFNKARYYGDWMDMNWIFEGILYLLDVTTEILELSTYPKYACDKSFLTPPSNLFFLIASYYQGSPGSDFNTSLLNSLILWQLLLVPLKPGLLGRKTHELDSPNLGGHLLHHLTPALTFP
ncbi:hypothetical protein AVEN_10720-1 [Araneus ventricosus]|uniref:Uncharacterized protein n=1 Tax=Araneus ventricosus TaxID=182803 RepID=A0A4Y2G0S4_ARAVE|nr:hypothetical protein AVEN_10720-1 [Araneus ventricosus]